MLTLLLLTAVGAVQNYVTDNLQRGAVIHFKGEAEGGSITLVSDHFGLTYVTCSIATTRSQSGAEVVKSLVASMHASSNSDFNHAAANGASLYLMSGDYFMVGTETGFRVPLQPRFTTVNYAPATDQLTVQWIPEDTGMRVRVIGSGAEPVDDGTGVAIVSKFAANEHYDVRVSDHVAPKRNDMAFYICRVRSMLVPAPDICSRFIRIHVSGTLQEDLDNLPFYGNVCPNWEAWCPAGFQEGEPRVYQGEKSEVPEKERTIALASSPDTKFYCQMFEIKDKTPADGGIYRRYLGLIPGHTYRVYARFNTFEAKADAGDWALSFHAAADPPDNGLTPAQLAARDALPNGAKGPEAGRIALFHNGGSTTEGKWLKVSTGMQGAPASATDITIPEGSTSITAWVRVKGATASRFGMDWSALEDLTPEK